MRYFLILLCTLLVACGSVVPTVKPFKMDIQQGNVVTSKMLLQLRPGMTKSQVKFIMGSPLLVDSFHTNRWDYFYQLRQAGKIVEQRRVILDFDKDLLTKVRGDVVPEGAAGAATGNESAVAKTITVEPKPKQETSWTDKLKFWKKDEPVKNEAVKIEPLKELEKASVAPEIMREKTDALEANTSAAAGDAASIDVATPDTPSMLAVPIGGVLAPDAPATEVPTTDAPTLAVPTAEAPVITAPVVEAPAIKVPVIKAPIIDAPVAATSDLNPVAMPAAKDGERLIFRMDRSLDLKNLQSPEDVVPSVEMPKTDNAVAPTTTKPKKIEPPLPAEEAPGYFERMLEKIGF